VTILPWGIRNLTDFPRHPQYCSCPPRSILAQSATGHVEYLPRLLLIDASARVAFGSFSEAHRNFLSVRCVPIAEARITFFSVSFGENRCSELIFRGGNVLKAGP